MYSVLCNPIFWKEINDVISSKGEEILLKAIDTDIDVVEEFEKISRIAVTHIIIDITAIVDTKKLISAIKRYKIKNDKSQIVIIAPNYSPPNPVIYSLVKMGIYDIINPQSENLEDIKISEELKKILDNPSTFKKAVRWFLDEEMEYTKELNVINETNSRSRLKGSEKSKDERPLTITKEKIVGTVVIAIAGTIKRIGTTHTSISMATFLKNNGFKVALVEYYNSHHFNFIKNNYEDVREGENFFIIDNIHYYPFNDSFEILDILNDDFNYIIMDMGKYSECDMQEFKRSNVKMLVSGGKDWEITDLELILRTGDMSINMKNNYYFNFVDKETFNLIKDNMSDSTIGKFKCFQAAYNPNPFYLNKDSIASFKDILKDVLPESYKNNNRNNNSFKIKDIFRKFKGDKA